MIYNS